MASISVNALTKNYSVSRKTPGIKGTLKHFLFRRTETITAVDEISFSIQPGEMVGFIGPNGAGKTTTLKMLCGLIHPTSGDVSVIGHKPHSLEPGFLKQITLVMGQKQQLLWDLPPLDSIKVNAAVYGISPRETNNRIDELASMLGLGNELNRPVRKLSLGERMKAELLAALLHRPSILFLDEPTLGLDVISQVRVREFLSSYNERYGATMLLSSHYMGDITSLCDRVILIHHGQIIHDGSLITLTEKLAPLKSVRLELNKPQTRESIGKYGLIEDYTDTFAQLLIPRKALTSSISNILRDLPVTDLEVSDPPIEELIRQLFESGENLSI